MHDQSPWPKDYLNPPSVGDPSKPRPGRQERRHRSLIWEILETALLTLVVFLLVRTVVLNFKVDGLSMAPTLHHGQYLLVNRIVYLDLGADVVGRLFPDRAPAPGQRNYLFRAPQRGDIVVFWPPSGSPRPFIKRIIGLPGETVEVRAGQVLIDGIALDEPYIKSRAAYSTPTLQVPVDQYYVLGDNRNNSSDSHLFGMLPAEHIIGQAWVSYWPIDSWGVLMTPAYAAPVGNSRIDSDGSRWLGRGVQYAQAHSRVEASFRVA